MVRSTAPGRLAWQAIFVQQGPICDRGGAMTEELDRQIRPALRRRRRSSLIPVGVVVFAPVASACAYAWVNYGDQVQTAEFGAPPTTAPETAGGEEPVSRANFDAFKRQTVDSLRSTLEGLDAQKADMKRLSDQLAALSAKTDAQ
jgi:hypothetical protein